jgi:hypothetical protein
MHNCDRAEVFTDHLLFKAPALKKHVRPSPKKYEVLDREPEKMVVLPLAQIGVPIFSLEAPLDLDDLTNYANARLISDAGSTHKEKIHVTSNHARCGNGQAQASPARVRLSERKEEGRSVEL